MEQDLSLITPDEYRHLYSKVIEAEGLYDQRNYKEASALYNYAAKQTSANLSMTLYLRWSKSLEKQGDITEALNCAEKMIHLVPECSAGYLRSNELLVKQSRFEEALRVLADAEQNMADISHDIRSRRDQTLVLANQQNMQNLGQLSAEIFDMIFTKLSFTDRGKCLSVCRGWKERLENWPNFWDGINMDHYVMNIYQKKLQCLHACLVGKDIRGMVLGRTRYQRYCCPAPCDMMKLLKDLCQNNISVRKLQIHCTYGLPVKDCLPFISLNRHNLTCLDLMAECDATIHDVSCILGICSFLQTFTASYSSHRECKLSAPEHPLKLRHLCWLQAGRQQLQDMLTIAGSCPQLQILEFSRPDRTLYNYESVAQVLAKLPDLCPTIRIIRVSNGLNADHQLCSADHHMSSLDISSDIELASNCLDQVLLLLQYQLCHLQLAMKGEKELINLCSTVTTLGGLPALKLLDLTIVHDSEYSDDASLGNINAAEAIVPLLSKCGLIQELRFKDIDFAGCMIGDTFAKLQNLQFLALNSCKGLDLDDLKSFASSCDTMEKFTIDMNSLGGSTGDGIPLEGILGIATKFPKLLVLHVASKVFQGQPSDCKSFMQRMVDKKLAYLIIDFKINQKCLMQLLQIPTLLAVCLDRFVKMKRTTVNNAITRTGVNIPVYLETFTRTPTGILTRFRNGDGDVDMTYVCRKSMEYWLQH